MRKYFSIENNQTLLQVLSRQNNNFDVVRLIASIMVIYGHSFILFPCSGHEDVLRQLLKVDYSGSIAVCIFFFLSGMFVTQSLDNSQSLKKYIIARFCRIWPGLAACVFFTVILITPLFTKAPFFLNLGTAKYFINLSLFVTIGTLPGMFLLNHFPNAVNGSLWSLPVEVRCYFLVAIFWILGILKKPWLLFSILGLMLLAPNIIFVKGLLWHLLSNDAIKSCCFFLVGIIVYSYRKLIIINGILTLTFISITTILFKTPFFIISFYCTLCYFLLWFGSRKIIINLRLQGDYSYGVYLYGFLVQQIIASLLPSITSLTSLIIVYPIVFFLASLSWRFIEKPSIIWGKKIIVQQ